MSARKAVVTLSMVLFIVTLSYAIAVGVMGPIPTFQVRKLARFYLINTYNPFHRFLSAMTPAGVTAIVWDFRGLDTLYETAVFYLAIVSTVLLMRRIVPRPRRPKGLSLISKAGTKFVIALTLVVAAAIALHGHLTPGGGFQAGSAAAVTSSLIIVVYSLYSLIRVGASKERLLAVRSAGLFGIALTSISLFIIGLLTGSTGFIMQNQPKPGAPLGFPYMFAGMLVSGTPLILNILEAMAVAMAFTLLFFVLSVPEEDASKALSAGGEEGE